VSLLTIFVGIAVLVWFYLTAKDKVRIVLIGLL